MISVEFRESVQNHVVLLSLLLCLTTEVAGWITKLFKILNLIVKTLNVLISYPGKTQE